MSNHQTTEQRWHQEYLQRQQQQRLQERYQMKQKQKEFRKEFRGTPEDQRYVRNAWRWVTAILLGIGGLIYILPVWVIGIGILAVFVLVAGVGIALGVKEGRGE